MGTPTLNIVVLAGNLTADPDLKMLDNGTAICSFDVASSREYQAGDGSMKKDTLFVKVVSFGRQAEACAEYLIKGQGVIVDGRLHLNKWQNDAGENRSKIEVRANRIQFLQKPGWKRGDDSGDQPAKEDPFDAEGEVPF